MQCGCSVWVVVSVCGGSKCVCGGGGGVTAEAKIHAYKYTEVYRCTYFNR